MVMVLSEEFNRGFWCAVEEFSAQGANRDQIVNVIRSAGFEYNECIELMNDSDYERDYLGGIVEEIFSNGL